MRDVIVVPLDEEESLVIATDNSGAVGEKELDKVKVPYEVLSFYTFRVAVMECIAAGAKPISVIIHNFCGDDAWKAIVKGIEKGIKELSLPNMQITGSTESNFPSMQSAIGITVVGKRKNADSVEKVSLTNHKIAVIGTPLVGNDVIKHADKIAPLSLFYEVCQLEGAVVLPVGSKGIFHELNQLLTEQIENPKNVIIDVNIFHSSGPNTSFIVAYPLDKDEVIRNLAHQWFHHVEIIENGD